MDPNEILRQLFHSQKTTPLPEPMKQPNVPQQSARPAPEPSSTLLPGQQSHTSASPTLPLGAQPVASLTKKATLKRSYQPRSMSRRMERPILLVLDLVFKLPSGLLFVIIFFDLSLFAGVWRISAGRWWCGLDDAAVQLLPCSCLLRQLQYSPPCAGCRRLSGPALPLPTLARQFSLDPRPRLNASALLPPPHSTPGQMRAGHHRAVRAALLRYSFASPGRHLPSQASSVIFCTCTSARLPVHSLGEESSQRYWR